MSVVNAISEYLTLTIYRNGKVYQIKFKDGVANNRLSIIGNNSEKNGTEINFKPSSRTF